MKNVVLLATVAVFSFIISGCNKSSAPAGATVVGTWDCTTKSEGDPANLTVSDTKTFGADGQYSSSKAPEGKSYKYRLDGDKLIFSFPYGEWIEKVTSMTNDSLEYYNDKSGKPVKTACQKSKK